MVNEAMDAIPGKVSGIAPQEPDERLVLMARVLGSQLFVKSPRLKSFLEFICTRTVAGKTAQINEQQIGIKVFGREPSYNPGEDSIVRSQARFLRQRLEEYFRTEGRDEPVQIVIPKGTYVPVFQKVTSPAPLAMGTGVDRPVTGEGQTVSDQTSGGRASRHLRWVWVATAIVALLLAVDIWTRRSAQREAGSGSTHPLWAAMFSGMRPTIVVPSDSTLVILEDLTKTPVHLDQYLDRNYIGKIALPTGLGPLTASDIYSHQYTSIADLEFAAQFVKLPEAKSARTAIRYARDLRMGDLKQSNVVLVGGARANPWIELFSAKTPYYVDYNAAGGNTVSVRAWGGQPAATYGEDAQDASRRAYGVVAFLAGLDGQGQTLLVEGTSMAGTESASDFLFDEASFAPFAKQIVRSDGTLPHFEVLLETNSIGGNAPQSRVVSFRILP